MNKKMQIAALVVMLFSCCSGLFTEGIKVKAEEQEPALYRQEGLTINCSHRVEETEAENIWHVTVTSESKEETRKQRLKIKLTDANNQTIDYPSVKGMEEKAGWLVEKDYGSSNKRTLKIPQSKKTAELFLTVQVDEKTTEKNGEETLRENLLPEGVSKKLYLDKTKAEKAKANSEKTADTEVVEEEPAARTSGSFLQTMATGIGPFSMQSGAVSLSRNLLMYNPKVPEYTPDHPEIGIYPKYYWEPTGQEYVRNHQGGIENRSGWDGVTSWNNTNRELTKSYIHYGYNAQVANKANISMRKMARQEGTDNRFKVTVNVRGETNFEPGVDIVLLLDNSKSLNSTTGSGTKMAKDISLEMVKKLVDSLCTLKDTNKANIRLGAHTFAAYENGSMNGTSTIPISGNTATWKTIYGPTGYGQYPGGGGTFTQRAIVEANNLFENIKRSDEAAGKTYNRKKMLMIFTDGAPNLSWTPTQTSYDGEMYYDKVRVTQSADKTGSYYRGGSPLGATHPNVKFDRAVNYGGRNINSHLTIANSAAKDVKEKGVEIHTIAVNINKEPGEGHSISELNEGLFRMASRKANATGALNKQDDYFYQKGSIDSLEDYIRQWYNEISRTIAKGEIEDPLGDMVEYVGGYGHDYFGDPRPSAPTSVKQGRTIAVSNLNLTKGQEYEYWYWVRLKTDHPDYVPGKWYPVNKVTTLKPTPERSPDVLEFGVPSIRLKDDRPKFSVPVEKKWEDKRNGEEDFWGLRPSKVTAILQKRAGPADLKQVDLTPGNDWKGTFDPVLGEQTVFQIVEKDRVKGYAKAVYTPATFTEASLGNGTVTMTNKLMTTNYTFKKVSHDGRTPFTGTDKPKFKVTRQGKSGLTEKVVVTDIEPTDDGTVTIENLPIGSYTVEETSVPAGYEEMTPFTIEVTENDAATAVVAKVSGQTGQHKVVNRLNPFRLIVSKVNQNKAPLVGAKFKLTGPNGYEETLFSGSTFTFEDLEQGTYTLTEVTPPEGYAGLSDPLTIMIHPNGTVSTSDDPFVTLESSLENNEIRLTVKNARSGTLPSTGGSGLKTQRLLIAACVLIGLSLTGYLILLEKRERKTKSS